MPNAIRLVAILSLILAAGCSKPPAPLSTASPTPVPSSASAPIPTPPPATPPQARLAPKGTYYLVKAASITTDAGIIGEPPGREVQFVRAESSHWIVSDGQNEFPLSEDSLTNDLDAVDAIKKDNDRLKLTLVKNVQTSLNVVAQQKKQTDDLQKSNLKSEVVRKISELQVQIDALSAKISEADRQQKQLNENKYIAGASSYRQGYYGARVVSARSSEFEVQQTLQALHQQRDALCAEQTKLKAAETAK